MPKKPETSDNSHQIDKNDRHKRNIAFPFFSFGIEPHEQILETEKIKKIKKFIKESGLAKAIYFGDIFSVGKILGNPSLISIGGMPG